MKVNNQWLIKQNITSIKKNPSLRSYVNKQGFNAKNILAAHIAG